MNFPQYDDRLFIELLVQYKKTTSSVHVVYIKLVFCFDIQNNLMSTTFTEYLVLLYWTHNSVNNLSSYFWLIDARMSASDKYLPVLKIRKRYNFSDLTHPPPYWRNIWMVTYATIIPLAEADCVVQYVSSGTCGLESFLSRFFDKVEHETTLNLVEISIFSLNNVTVRPPKITNRAEKIWALF